MNANQLKQLQEPIKQGYRDNPESAKVVLKASGRVLQDKLQCVVTSPGLQGMDQEKIVAGLHTAAGGPGNEACSGEMLLASLVACAGVTLAAVSTAMSITIRSATVEAQGEMDFRGTLGVDRAVPVGIQRVAIQFTIDSDGNEEQVAKLIQLTERYCVILQTLRNSIEIESTLAR